jgi:cellulose synthase/poly-beta-1,6-N-acetylglucosamine synthase-like glycosyltransferase
LAWSGASSPGTWIGDSLKPCSPADGEWYEVAWVWFCFIAEILALFDALMLYLMFLRTSDRSAEADVHEARLRSLPAEELPSVDVFIPTYNESIEVLEKTITGALCLDYPNFKIWILDDGRRPWLLDLCASRGVGYLTRENNTHAKAGNINHALTKTNAEFFAIFDADFIPQRNFLIRTMGFFVDPSKSYRSRTPSIITIRPNPAWHCRRRFLTISASSSKRSCEAGTVGTRHFVAAQIP